MPQDAKIPYPLPDTLLDKLVKPFQEGHLWSESLPPGADFDKHVGEASGALGGDRWCDANKVLKELAGERFRGALPAGKFKEYNKDAPDDQKVDWQKGFSEPGALETLLNQCRGNNTLELKVKDPIQEVVVQDSPDSGGAPPPPPLPDFSASAWRVVDGNITVGKQGSPNYKDIRLEILAAGLATLKVDADRDKRTLDYDLTGGKESFYKLALRLVFPLRGVSISHPLKRLWEPWKTALRRIPPIVKPGEVGGQPLYFWGWRADARAPEDIFRNGFKPKLESQGNLSQWKALTTAYTDIKAELDTALQNRHLPDANLSANRVWFRYRDEDLCLNTSAAVATCFAGAVMFPLPPGNRKAWKLLPVRRGEQNAHDNQPEVSYVYAIRKPIGEVHDIGHVQHLVTPDNGWAEVAMRRVEPEEILFALEVERWPLSKHRGWFRVTNVIYRQKNGDPDDPRDIDKENERNTLQGRWPVLWKCLKQYLLPIPQAPQVQQPAQQQAPEALFYEWTNRRGKVLVEDDGQEVGCAGSGTEHATDLPPLPPARPTALAATPENGKVVLTWTGSQTATSYKIKRSRTSGGDYEVINKEIVSDSSYEDEGDDDGTEYYYVVVALNSGGESQDSNEASAMRPPPAPTGLRCSARSKRVNLSWGYSANASSYTVKRKAKGGSYGNVKTVVGTFYADRGLKNGKKYCYKVTAANNGGDSLDSNEAIGTPRWFKKW
ncbi:MAG: hypothetical protein WBF17_06485 [Phycisphaerae bacterium]